MIKRSVAAARQFFIGHNINGWILFLIAVYAVLAVKLVTLKYLNESLFFGAYSILVSFYILSRFFISRYYKSEDGAFDKDYLPTVSFGVPSKNEEGNIRETILKIADSDYPKGKFDIIAVNDGSSDKTLREMRIAKRIAAKKDVEVIVVNWKKNRGKREGMAECIRRSKHELMIFIDSDSFVEKNTTRALVKYFVNKKVAAVAGHAYVANENKNILTKMQSVRYFVAFRAYKASEALFGAVTCCSGCCSAYRREYALEVLDEWLGQSFLGVRCTYGDDRSLTNYLLQKNYHTLYASDAKSRTFVPETFKKFMRQQLRWKKSWVRESLKASTFLWKRNPIMSVFFYIGVILPLIAPVVVVRALIWYPAATNKFPYFYLFGLMLMAAVYGLYYFVHTRDKKWVFGMVFATFYTLVLIWQLPYAILSLRDARWGTR